jgi:hypothetical protein
MYFGLIEVLTH